MSAWNVSRKGSVVRIVAAIVAVAAISCSAKDRGGPQPATATAQRDGSIGQACLGRAPTQVLSLRNAENAAFNLAYFHGCGWRYLPVRQTTDHSVLMCVSEEARSTAAIPTGVTLPLIDDAPDSTCCVYD